MPEVCFVNSVSDHIQETWSVRLFEKEKKREGFAVRTVHWSAETAPRTPKCHFSHKIMLYWLLLSCLLAFTVSLNHGFFASNLDSTSTKRILDFELSLGNSSCLSVNSCSQCVSQSTGGDQGEECLWCSGSDLCVSTLTADSYCQPSDQERTCDTSYYTIIFTVVLCALFCLCCTTCYMRRFRGGSPGDTLMTLPVIAREFLYRNSLILEGRLEWMCIICGFDNKPMSSNCIMCGTSHQFSIDYKIEKKEREKTKMKMKKGDMLRNPALIDKSNNISANNGANRTRALQNTIASIGSTSSTSSIENTIYDDQKNNGVASLNRSNDIIVNAEDNKNNTESMTTADDGNNLRQLSQESVTSNLSTSFSIINRSLSQADRQEALYYRRLNQLSLRQKSARRRRMWQRTYDPHSQGLIWVRAPPKKTKIGGKLKKAYMGYTPGNSLAPIDLEGGMNASDASDDDTSEDESEDMEVRRASMEDADEVYIARLERMEQPCLINMCSDLFCCVKFCCTPCATAVYCFCCCYTKTKKNKNKNKRHNEGDGAATDNPITEALLSAATRLDQDSDNGGNDDKEDEESEYSDESDEEERRKRWLRQISKDGDRSPPIPIAGNGTWSDSMGDGHTRLSSSSNRERYSSKDSFGDSVLLSSSPGYTTVFDEEGGGLRWERVGHHKPAILTPFGDSIDPSSSSSSKERFIDKDNWHVIKDTLLEVVDEKDRISYLTRAEELYNILDAADLIEKAALSFKEKQTWFMNTIEKMEVPWQMGCIRMEIRRDAVLQDTVAIMSQVYKTDIHKWMRIMFTNEPGIDAGGLVREWLGLVVEELFAPQAGLFVSSSGGTLGGGYHINPTSGIAKEDHLRYFTVAGKLFGKAIMEQHTIAAHLSLPLRKQILGLPITFSDLEFCDPVLYRSLLYIKHCSSVELDSLYLDFTVSYPVINTNAAPPPPSTPSTRGDIPDDGSDSHSKNSSSTDMFHSRIFEEDNQNEMQQQDWYVDRSVPPLVYELKPDGANISVSIENREEYLQLVLANRMLHSIKPQVECFLKGIYEVIPPELLSILDYQELELLMCGIPEIDMYDWKRHTEYLGVYSERHKVIKWFWEFVEECDYEERARLLHFVTGCARVPAQGFKALVSNDGRFRKFNVQSIRKKDCMWPRANTCFNKLQLPYYQTKDELYIYMSCVTSGDTHGFTIE